MFSIFIFYSFFYGTNIIILSRMCPYTSQNGPVVPYQIQSSMIYHIHTCITILLLCIFGNAPSYSLGYIYIYIERERDFS